MNDVNKNEITYLPTYISNKLQKLGFKGNEEYNIRSDIWKKVLSNNNLPFNEKKYYHDREYTNYFQQETIKLNFIIPDEEIDREISLHLLKNT